ncbi:tetratricopeptide repeat protein, partial [bacterium]|nr:tetratricopeptide repeat protein [bacterium]
MAFWTRFLKRKSPLLEGQPDDAGAVKKAARWVVRQKPFWASLGLCMVIIGGFFYYYVFVRPYSQIDEKLMGIGLERPPSTFERAGPRGGRPDTSEIPDIRESVVESRAEAVSLIRLAEVHYQKGLIDPAKDALIRAISLTSDTSLLSTAYANLSNILDGEGRLVQAEQFLQRALTFDRRFVKGYHNLGVVYVHMHEYDKALLAFQVAVREEPDFAQAHAGIGEVHSIKGNFAESIRAYTEALRLREDPQVRLNLGLAYLQSENIPKAIEEFTAVLAAARDPYMGYLAHFNRGFALDSSRRYEEAVSDYQAALERAPKDVDARFNLGLSLMALKRQAEALAAFRRVVELDRDNMDAYLNAVAMHSELGQYPEALALLRPVHDRIPHNIRVNYQLGHLYHRVGQLGDAHDFFNQTLGPNPYEQLTTTLKADA